MKPENRELDRIDRRLKENRSGKRRVVVIMRERDGKSLPYYVGTSEDEALTMIHERVAANSTVYADEAACWDILNARFNAKRINHSIEYSTEDACTNQAESYFSRLRRAEVGTHHHISGRYLQQYANEMAWREDHRREPNGQQFLQIVEAAISHPVSREWKRVLAAQCIIETKLECCIFAT